MPNSPDPNTASPGHADFERLLELDGETLRWRLIPLQKFGPQQLFDLIKLRIDVFVVEQACAYPELDELDKSENTLHLTLHNQSNELLACARLMFPPNGQDEEKALAGQKVSLDTDARIGRVAVRAAYRGRGLSRQLLEAMLDFIEKRAPRNGISLSAQSRLVPFYQSLGFTVISDEYLEDGIAHVEMRRAPTPGLH